jgi:hypothetical protein
VSRNTLIHFEVVDTNTADALLREVRSAHQAAVVEVEKLAEMIAWLETRVSSPPPGAKATKKAITVRPGGTIKKRNTRASIRSVLDTAGHPLIVDDISRLVQQTDWTTSSQDPDSIIRTFLRRMVQSGEIKREGRFYSSLAPTDAAPLDGDE